MLNKPLFTIFLLITLFGVACGAAQPTTSTPTPPAAVSSAPTSADDDPDRPAVVVDPLPAADPTDYEEYDIVTLLPFDAIPAIDDPQFLTAAEAQDFYDPDELVIGVEFNGDARAYSVPFLSSHEIVNDTVGGVKIAATW